MNKRIIFLSIILSIPLVMSVTLFAQGIFAVDSSLKPIDETAAYQQFSGRPYSELSKIIYLIDRFGETDVEILYDGHYFRARFVKQIARWFLFHHYKKETAEQWILRWCHKTIPSGNLIWVKMPDASLRLAREILFEELKDLDGLHFKKAQQAQKEAVSALENPAPVPSVTKTVIEAAATAPAVDQAIPPAAQS